MGNTCKNSDNGQHGNIYVQTDKPFYYAGDLVQGTAYVNITAGGYPGNQLIIKIKGVETCRWEEQHTRTVGEGQNMRSEVYTEIFNGRNLCFREQMVLF